VLLAVLVGACAAGGVLLIVRGIVGPLGDPQPARVRRSPWAGLVADRARPGARRRLLIAVGVGLLVGLVTRWPVGALLGALAAWMAPTLVGADHDYARKLARIEAVATWTESLRDTLAAAAGLEQAIMATAPLSPAPIRAEVVALAGRLRRGDRLSPALRVFAAALDDATGDLVVTALVMAADRNARHIGDLLSSLAEAARDQASLRMRVAAGRARVRTSLRVTVGVTLLMAAGLVLFNRHYVAPYNTVSGQLVLLVVGALFGFGFLWMSRIARFTEPARVLSTADPADRVEVGA
jgi:Flp pilus assembly protein TadB